MTPEDPNFSRAQGRDFLDAIVLAVLAAGISIVALIFYYRHNAILLYGDAVAHINIARRVFDSRTPGLFELGTVWLPLPHVLDIPFIVNQRLWQTGLGASIPSMLAYIAGTLGIFRLVRDMASRLAAWTAALIFALNPNLLYMQATAMTESLYLALFIWAVVYFAEFCRGVEQDAADSRRALEKCGLLMMAAMLVRYDGWFLAAVIAIAAVVKIWRAWPVNRKLRRGLLSYLLLTGAVAVLWLAYNYAGYGNPLEFANGPYSAKAIQQRSWTPTWTSYPGENSPRTATLYFMKAARLSLGEGKGEYLLFTVAFVGLLCVFFFARRFLPWALLWTPLIFYPACIAWGSVPLYLPQWWPFGYYNLRYGLQMLPAAAVFAALMVEFNGNFFPRSRIRAAAVLMALAVWSYGSVWSRTPIMLREARVNGAARMRFERQLAGELKKLPASATIMMDCSAYSGAVQEAGIPFRRVLRESNPPQWEVALTQPAESADYVVAIGQDAVASSVRLYPQRLRRIALVGASDGLQASIYRAAR
ncbi:MAG TPA: hypothetical protein VFP59_09605 [Candidatus Angelobacter sp.]|nr:hypothetical protein [Candidatus Angelobacter sp.]